MAWRESRRQKSRRRRHAEGTPGGSDATVAKSPKLKSHDPGNVGGTFAARRGQLRLPVKGTIAGRFGQPRPEGGASWKGVFIRAAEGLEVRAVAAGAVVFSDWLRGFGNLLVIDHGDDFLSIYGNNESLLAGRGRRHQGWRNRRHRGKQRRQPRLGFIL
jgi:septal ring factor EnvC (AmiA/AmiB activator)